MVGMWRERVDGIVLAKRWLRLSGVPAAVAAIVLLATALPAGGLARRADPGPIDLAPGESAFWDGATVGDGAVHSSGMCGVTGPCFKYLLRLAGGAWRLRVAIDTPSRQDSFELDLIDPSGEVAASSAETNVFDQEAFVPTPAAGTWTVRVLPVDATDAFFRLRAKLERQPRLPSGHEALLPNLKTVPPTELTFTAPANPANGAYPPDTVNPPFDVAGFHPVSCTADEAAPEQAGGFDARRCLRLTSGPINVGPGPYDMRFTFAQDLAAGRGEVAAEGGTIEKAPMFQAVHYADGTVEKREAGTYSFHLTHAHFHDNNILTYQLWRVTDRRRGELAKAASGTKSGFCPADQLFGEWRRFKQEPTGYFGEGDVPTGNCFSPNDGFMGLTVGWGDIYRWQRPGQYVEFAGSGDGLYVVRSIVDVPNAVLEANENDNVSYAYIRVVGERVDILERGQGRDPWDPNKVVFTGSGPASQN